MNRPHVATVAALSAVFFCSVAPAQMAHEGAGMATMEHQPPVLSTTLTLTGLDGTSKTLSTADLMRMPQTTVTVTNGHTHQQETYAGVPVRDLLVLVSPPKMLPVAGADSSMKAKSSPRLTVIVARGTDGYRVAMTLCDTDPGCRSGQAIVADTKDGAALTNDGAFKLILSEDKTPGRWVHNLDALTMKNLGGM